MSSNVAPSSGPTSTPEEVLKRIESHKSVIGSIIVNEDGIPIRTTLDNTTTVLYASLLRKVCLLAEGAIHNLHPQDEMLFLRIRTKKDEIIVAPDSGYLMIVIQALPKQQ